VQLAGLRMCSEALRSLTVGKAACGTKPPTKKALPRSSALARRLGDDCLRFGSASRSPSTPIGPPIFGSPRWARLSICWRPYRRAAISWSRSSSSFG